MHLDMATNKAKEAWCFPLDNEGLSFSFSVFLFACLFVWELLEMISSIILAPEPCIVDELYSCSPI